MQTLSIAAALLSLALLPSNLSAQTCNTTDADRTAVADTLRTFYAAAAVDDFAKIHTVTAPTFYAFDNGQQFPSVDALLNLVKSYQDHGAKFVWNLTNPEVTLHCNDAWITYLNDGSVQLPNTTAPTPTQWLESAVLERQNGSWKILFFHSTRVPPLTPLTK
jgi:hypothetical protein